MSAPGNSQAFWDYWFLALGIIGLLWVIATKWDNILDLFEGMGDSFGGESARPISDYEENHQCKVRRWRVALPLLTRTRRRAEGVKAHRRSLDAMAESLATHQEIVETLYGESPSVWDAYRQIKRR